MIRNRYLFLFPMVALAFNPCVAASQKDEQLVDAFVLAVQRSVGQTSSGKSVLLAPLGQAQSDPVREKAYEKLLEAGYRLHESPAWPDSMTVLVSLGGPRSLRSASEISVSFLYPDQPAFRGPKEGYQPYGSSFKGYVLTCSEGKCDLSQDAVLGSGGGLIRLDCIPDYFQRSPEEREGCTVPR